MLFSSPWSEQWRIAINSVVLASRYRERLFLFGGSHKTKWDLMISHQKFPGHQDEEAGREVQGTEQLSPLKIFRCHLGACCNNRQWKWTVRRQVAAERWSETWVQTLIQPVFLKPDYLLGFQKGANNSSHCDSAHRYLNPLLHKGFPALSPWHLARCPSCAWVQAVLALPLVPEQPFCLLWAATTPSILADWCVVKGGAQITSLHIESIKGILLFCCVWERFSHSDWLLDRICNAASLSQKMTHNDFCYHLRMFRQNK